MESHERPYSKKELETITWVRGQIKSTGFIPTYEQIAENFKISKIAAYMRVRRFRNEMRRKI